MPAGLFLRSQILELTALGFRARAKVRRAELSSMASIYRLHRAFSPKRLGPRRESKTTSTKKKQQQRQRMRGMRYRRAMGCCVYAYAARLFLLAYIPGLSFSLPSFFILSHRPSLRNENRKCQGDFFPATRFGALTFELSDFEALAFGAGVGFFVEGIFPFRSF